MTEPAPQNDQAKKPITYVLVGDDWSGALKGTVEKYSEDKNVVLIRASEFETLEKAVVQIKTRPANIILACHGDDDGTFTWRNDADDPKYGELFKELKKLPASTIGTITLLKCYGETAQKMLGDVPEGAILQSLTSTKSENNAYFSERFQEETVNVSDPIALILENLDNVSPDEYKKVIKTVSEEDKKNMPDPKDIMPSLVGIGGNPPIVIDLDKTTEDFIKNAPDHRRDMRQAIKMVKEHFDTNDISVLAATMEKLGSSTSELIEKLGDSKEDSQYKAKLVQALKAIYPKDADKITIDNYDPYFGKLRTQMKKEAEEALDNKIAAVANKMKHGEAIATDKDGEPDLDELRIRRALGIAYLKTSGELDKLVKQAKDSVRHEEKQQTVEPPAQEKDTSKEPPSGVSGNDDKDTSFSNILGKYGLSKADFNVALHPDTTAYKPEKQPSQGQGHGGV